jgi:hypothetical protein
MEIWDVGELEKALNRIAEADPALADDQRMLRLSTAEQKPSTGRRKSVSACAGDPLVNREVAVNLEPMAKPASLPAEVAWAGKGGGTYKLVESQGDKVTWVRLSEGEEECIWSNDGWFSPTWEWKGCGGDGGDGHQEASKEGDIWPLQVGKMETYQVQGKDEKYTWQTTRTCEVKDAVMLTVAESQHPTYEVVCADKYSTRTWYISPEMGQVLRYKRVHNKRGVVEDITAEL